MTKIIHLQDSTYGDFTDADLVVTKYEIGDWCGSGEALVLRNDNVEYHNLSHCSCYGPFEGGPDETILLEDFLKDDCVVSSWSDEIERVFKALVKDYC